MPSSVRHACAAAILLAAVAACGGKNSPDTIEPETRLERAMQSFEQEEYGDAASAFQEFR